MTVDRRKAIPPNGAADPVHFANEPAVQDNRWPEVGYRETLDQRPSGGYVELLQEIRIAQMGVQFLLAFLLALAFTPRFAECTEFQRHVYLASLISGSAATAILIAPAPFHRLVLRRGLRRELVRISGFFVVAGLVLLMLSLGAALLLVLAVVVDTYWASWITGGILTWFVLWWFLVPLCSRARQRRG